MGNAFSWLVSQIFGDKEARILILGLDNGLFRRMLCRRLTSRRSERGSAFLLFARSAILTRPFYFLALIYVLSTLRSGKDIHPVPSQGGYLPRNCPNNWV
jgi:hypothetical protein